MVLRVEPEELESQAVRVEGFSEQFGLDLDTIEREVEGLGWDGQAREAFVSLFAEARTQFRDVEAWITNIAATLREAKNTIMEADSGASQGISR